MKVRITDNIKLSEHEYYKWQSMEEVRKNPKINDVVKYTLEIYYFNFIENKH